MHTHCYDLLVAMGAQLDGLPGYPKLKEEQSQYQPSCPHADMQGCLGKDVSGVWKYVFPQ